MPMRAPRENAIWIRDLRAGGPVQAEALTDPDLSCSGTRQGFPGPR